MPALPGTANNLSTVEFCASDHTSACSRAPEPTTKTLTRAPPAHVTPSRAHRLALHRHHLLALGTDADPAHRHAGDLFDATNVGLRGRRQIGERASTTDVFAPALKLFVHRRAFVEDRLVRRELVVGLAFVAVRRADLDRRQPAEEVELR